MIGHMWLPEHLMKQQEFCRSAEWVWGVLWLYTYIGYIEEVSTAGISLDHLLELLVGRQLEALTFVGVGRLQVENDGMQGRSRTESDDDRRQDPSRPWVVCTVTLSITKENGSGWKGAVVWAKTVWKRNIRGSI